MKTWRTVFRTIIGTAGALGLAFSMLFFSCTQKPPTAPQSTAIVSHSLQAVSSIPNGNPATVVTFNPDKLDSASIKVGATAFRTIGFDGDTVAFPIGDKDAAYLIIPRGAVKLGLNILLNLKGNVMLTTDGTMSVSMFNFLPDGLVFEKDCYLIQPARFPDGTQLELSWRNPFTGEWVRENVSTVSNGRVIFKIKHFSDYGAPLEALSSGGQNTADDGVD